MRSRSCKPTRPVALLALVVLALASGGCDTGGDDGPAPAPAPRAERPAPAADTEAPRFAGLQSVESLGAGMYRLRWFAGEDNRTAAQDLRYEVVHVASPWQRLEDGEVLATTPPGALRYDLVLDGRAGRFAVRAVDASGNRSALRGGLVAPPPPSWLHAVEGTTASSLRWCEPGDSGQAWCMSEDGELLQWDRNRWRTGLARGMDRLHVTRSAETLVLWSQVGDVVQVLPDGTVRTEPARFMGGEPGLPLRQMAGDSLGTVTVLDRDGAVWMGVAPVFRRAERPLLLPRGDRCVRLRGVVHARTDGFAVCEEGPVWTIGYDRRMPRWLPLVADVGEGNGHGLRGAAAVENGRVLVLTDRGIRLLGGGDGEALEPVYEAPEGGWVGGWRRDPALGVVVATSEGLLRWRGDRLVPIAGGAGPLVGWIGPTPLEPEDQWTVFHADGAVAALRRGRSDWKVPPALGGIEAIGRREDGVLLVSAGRPSAGVHALEAQGWRRVSEALPSIESVAWRSFAARRSGVVVAVGQQGDAGVLRVGTGRLWREPSLRLHPFLLPETAVSEDTEEADGFVFEEAFVMDDPLAVPMRPEPGVALAAAPGDWRVEPLEGVEVSSGDGRFLAWGRHQVFGSADGTSWMLWAVTPRPLVHAFPDGGEAWMALHEDGVERCVRHLCEGVPMPAVSPETVMSAWMDGDSGWVLDRTGALWRFWPGDPPAAGTPPVAQVPGRFERVADAIQRPPERPVGRVVGADEDVALGEDGAWMRRDADGDWRVWQRRPDALGLRRVGEGAAVVTRDGVLRLGEVAAQRRGGEEDSP